MALTLRQMTYFCALVETKHFGRAARSVNISQPALSLQVKEMEQTLGVTLVERRSRKMLITPIGYEVAQRAQDVLAGVRDMQDVARWSTGLTGRLKLGVIPTIAPYLLPVALPLLRAQNIALDLRVREGQTDQILRDLADGELDAAVLALPTDALDLVEKHLFDDCFLLAGSSDMIARPYATPNDVEAGQLLLLDEGHCLADQALEVCSIDRSQTRMDFAASSLATLSGLASAGFGLTFLPEITLKNELAAAPNLYVKRFDTPEPFRRIGLVRRTLSGDDGWFSDLAVILTTAGTTLTNYARGAYPI